MSQKEFAEKIGVSLISYQRYEANKRIPPDHVLSRIASEFNKTIDWILGIECLESKTPSLLAEKDTFVYVQNDSERGFVEKLLQIFRRKDDNTILAIKQNIDQFLRVPDKEEAAQAEEKPSKHKRRAAG